MRSRHSPTGGEYARATRRIHLLPERKIGDGSQLTRRVNWDPSPLSRLLRAARGGAGVRSVRRTVGTRALVGRAADSAAVERAEAGASRLAVAPGVVGFRARAAVADRRGAWIAAGRQAVRPRALVGRTADPAAVERAEARAARRCVAPGVVVGRADQLEGRGSGRACTGRARRGARGRRTGRG